MSESGYMVPIDQRCLVSMATGYATFGSWNQHIVPIPGGALAAVLVYANTNFTSNRWRVFRLGEDINDQPVVCGERTCGTNAPLLEPGRDGAVFLIHSDWDLAREEDPARALVYRLGPESGYEVQDPIAVLSDAGGMKTAALWDASRELLYYVGCHHVTYRMEFRALTADGAVVRSYTLGTSGPMSEAHYPLLALDDDGTLIFAWTTTNWPDRDPPYRYRSIHAIRSSDGGESWSALDGASLPRDFQTGQDGPATRLALAPERAQVWLASISAAGGKLHALISVGVSPTWDIGYTRWSFVTGQMEVPWRIHSAGHTFLPHGFLARSDQFLYFVRPADGAQLVEVEESRDGGVTWHPYAATDPLAGRVYFLTGYRLVEAGRIIGLFSYSPPAEIQAYTFATSLGLGGLST